ncbi:hypothetical protein [Anabaena azotica]|uniref:Uncharacterized protein n=1 Tax=Anabaena azotica FACHB-119 TaxID=947527 RepID=A0ABR8DF10_9NOST|nr:hypothetical protein [Anabaena azotica]MBD2505561.1 hypothetical protein [Anabaena azotica FACHB-119]
MKHKELRSHNYKRKYKLCYPRHPILYPPAGMLRFGDRCLHKINATSVFCTVAVVSAPPSRVKRNPWH